MTKQHGYKVITANQKYESKHGDTHLTHLSSQIAPCGQMFKPEKAVPVACTSPAWVMVNHLATAKHANTNYNKPALFI